MLNLLSWIVFGLIVGALAKLIMPGRDPGGFLITALLGICGAVLGGWIARSMGYGDGQPVGWIVSILGAVLLLAIVRVARRGSPASLP